MSDGLAFRLMVAVQDLRNLSLAELKTWVQAQGLKPYAAIQIVQWLYEKRVSSFEEMTNLSKQARALLTGQFALPQLKIAAQRVAADGTIKFGFRLHDGAIVESVLMPQPGRITLCISSQVGCAMGCTFCKTATMKLKRNLTQGEILGQVIAAMRYLEVVATGPVTDPTFGQPRFTLGRAQRLARATRRNQHQQLSTPAPFDFAQGRLRHITNIVYMGMGEPLHNLQPVIESVKILLEQRAFNFSKKKVTVSTCGLAPQIIEFGQAVPARLAISLNAPTDSLRQEIMPINRRHDLDELMAACRIYAQERGDMVTLEYVLLAGVNDSLEHAKELVKRISFTPCKVNLIPFNEYAGSPYRRPGEDRILAFHKYLADKGFQVNIRYSKGLDAAAACGQLAV